MTEAIHNIFETHHWYPSDEIRKFGGIPEDTLYCFVSSTFLNGFINYVDVLEAFVIKRYSEGKEWEKVLSSVEKVNTYFHTNLSEICEDKIIAAETESCFWFFYYDQDCSDCVIGRISKDRIDKEEFLRLFNGLQSPKERVRLKLSGWIEG